MWYQKTLTLSAKSRGFHLVTDEILNQLADMPRVNIGLLHLLLQHTSASLTLNENCDPTWFSGRRTMRLCSASACRIDWRIHHTA